MVSTLDKGDLAAVEAGGAGDLAPGAASLLAAVWSALVAAAAAAAAIERAASPTFCAATPSEPPAATKHFSLNSGFHPQLVPSVCRCTLTIMDRTGQDRT